MNEGCLPLLVLMLIPIFISLFRSGILGQIFGSISDREEEKSSPYNYENFFTNLCRKLGQPTELIPLTDGSELERCDFFFQKRPVHLEFRKRRKPEKLPAYPLNDELTALDISQQKIEDAFEILEMRIPLKQKFWLRLNRQKLQEDDSDEIRSGVPELDREYVIHTNQSDAAEDFLRRMSVRKYLSNFPCTFERLEIVHGELSVTIHQPRIWQMKPQHLADLLKNLFGIIYEYQEHHIIALRITATKSEYRCPYCRTTFDENSGPIIQCKNCGTRLHEACWNENGQCTTWGCRSTVAI